MARAKDRVSNQGGFSPLEQLTSTEASALQSSPPKNVESALVEMMFDQGAKKAFDTASALAGQMHNWRFAWLTEINARALGGRPCLRSSIRPGSVSVHHPEYAELSMSMPYYGFVATTVEGHDLLLYSANDDNVARLYFYYGPDAYETLSMRIWQRLCQTAKCVYDVGAFTGIYSLVARSANTSCKCVAFEPMPHIRHRANMNIVINGLTGSIDLEPHVFSDSTRMETFYTSVGPAILDSGGSIAPRFRDGAVSHTDVQTTTLDGYVSTSERRAPPDLIKINAGFHELAVLAGARVLLETSRPTLLVEVSKTETLDQLLDVFDALDYTVFSVDDHKLRLYPHQKGLPAALNVGELDDDVHNIVACPNSGIAEIVQALA